MYSARISRKTPALFVILIDQSGSMEEPTTLYGKSVSKAEAVATTVNMLIGELLHRSRREEGYRDYFDIAVLGYHDEVVEPLLCKGKRLFVKPSNYTRGILHGCKFNGNENCRMDGLFFQWLNNENGLPLLLKGKPRCTPLF